MVIVTINLKPTLPSRRLTNGGLKNIVYCDQDAHTLTCSLSAGVVRAKAEKVLRSGSDENGLRIGIPLPCIVFSIV